MFQMLTAMSLLSFALQSVQLLVTLASPLKLFHTFNFWKHGDFSDIIKRM